MPPAKQTNETAPFQPGMSQDMATLQPVGIKMEVPEAIKEEPLYSERVEKTGAALIHTDAKFYSFADFETAFEQFKMTYFHPFRVASSEQLREPDGSINHVFKYRYIVYHCTHYGQPRQKAPGARSGKVRATPSLACGCKASLRLSFSFNEKVLKIAQIFDQHEGHDVSMDSYCGLQPKRGKKKASPTTKEAPPPKRPPMIPPPHPMMMMMSHSPMLLREPPAPHTPSTPVDAQLAAWNAQKLVATSNSPQMAVVMAHMQMLAQKQREGLLPRPHYPSANQFQPINYNESSHSHVAAAATPPPDGVSAAVLRQVDALLQHLRSTLLKVDDETRVELMEELTTLAELDQ